jgi:hypothetical protein
VDDRDAGSPPLVPVRSVVLVHPDRDEQTGGGECGDSPGRRFADASGVIQPRQEVARRASLL